VADKNKFMHGLSEQGWRLSGRNTGLWRVAKPKAHYTAHPAILK
jgi:hypothetical protein